MSEVGGRTRRLVPGDEATAKQACRAFGAPGADSRAFLRRPETVLLVAADRPGQQGGDGHLKRGVRAAGAECSGDVQLALGLWTPPRQAAKLEDGIMAKQAGNGHRPAGVLPFIDPMDTRVTLCAQSANLDAQSSLRRARRRFRLAGG